MSLSGVGNVSQVFCCLHSIANKICCKKTIKNANYNVTELCFLLALATILFCLQLCSQCLILNIPAKALASCTTNSKCFQHWWVSYEKGFIMFDSEFKDNISFWFQYLCEGLSTSLWPPHHRPTSRREGH